MLINIRCLSILGTCETQNPVDTEKTKDHLVRKVKNNGGNVLNLEVVSCFVTVVFVSLLIPDSMSHGVYFLITQKGRLNSFGETFCRCSKLFWLTHAGMCIHLCVCVLSIYLCSLSIYLSVFLE